MNPASMFKLMPGRARKAARGWLLAAVAPALAACSPVGTAIGVAATGINLATQERGFIAGIDDNVTWVGINQRLMAKDEKLFEKVSLQVHEGRVLLSGFVQKPEDRVEATVIAWQSSGVREVINEIRIGPSLGIDDYAEDIVIINQLKLVLMADSQVRANNFSIDCIRSTIYLLGIAHDETERRRVVNHARDIAYVRAVIDRTRLVSDALPPVPDVPPLVEPAPAPVVAVAEPVAGQPAAAAPLGGVPPSPITATPLP